MEQNEEKSLIKVSQEEFKKKLMESKRILKRRWTFLMLIRHLLHAY